MSVALDLFNLFSNLETSNRPPSGTLKSQSRTVEELSDAPFNEVITIGQQTVELKQLFSRQQFFFLTDLATGMTC